MSEENNKGCDCNCGCNHEHENDDHCGCQGEHQTVKLTFEDNEEVECNILGIYDVDERQYIALLPIDKDEVIIYRYSEEDGEAKLEQIESDEEYEKVGNALYEIFEDEEDFDEEIEEEEVSAE